MKPETLTAKQQRSTAVVSSGIVRPPTAREKRQWWAVADGDVREVTGYSCAPNNPDVWWCPEVGFSGAEGHHLFETRDEAFGKAIVESERDLTALQKRIEGLKRRRPNDAS
jgi:hypothetical protein